ncbi:MAG: membrane protein [Candidatus Sericytochromatia bacterium]|nr:MAG: membrane protein [Candidatus Sericytochromatia bacterium]
MLNFYNLVVYNQNLKYLYSLIIIIPFLIFLHYFSSNKRKSILKNFNSNIVFLNKKYYPLKTFFIILVFIFSIFALTEPKYGYKLEKIYSSKSNILIALDISDSMLAEDVQPNRLERGKREIIDLIDNLQGEKVGLIIFSGISFLQCPFTSDYSALKMFLDYIDTDLIPIKGTSFSNLFDIALKTFKDDKQEKYMIIISDGEDTHQNFNEYINKFKERNIKIFSIGVGDENGSAIKLKDGSYKKDKNNNIVISKLETKNLKFISNNTNGFFVKSDFTDDDIKTIYFKGIRNQNNLNGSYYQKKIWNEIFQYFLFIAFIFLIIEFLISNIDEKNKLHI